MCTCCARSPIRERSLPGQKRPSAQSWSAQASSASRLPPRCGRARSPERRPLERVLGREFGDFVRAIHEEHGVVFHLEETATAIDAANVRLKGGTTLPADL